MVITLPIVKYKWIRKLLDVDVALKHMPFLRLVFTNDGVGVGVVIRSVELMI